MQVHHQVLVVDDDAMIRSLLSTLLKRVGVRCDFAANVLAAAGAIKITHLDAYSVKAVLTKPFEIHELAETVTAIRETLDLREATAAGA